MQISAEKTALVSNAQENRKHFYQLHLAVRKRSSLSFSELVTCFDLFLCILENKKRAVIMKKSTGKTFLYVTENCTQTRSECSANVIVGGEDEDSNGDFSLHGDKWMLAAPVCHLRNLFKKNLPTTRSSALVNTRPCLFSATHWYMPMSARFRLLIISTPLFT